MNACDELEVYDCPDLEANVGDACTDSGGTASTIDANCTCTETNILTDSRDGQTYPTVVIGNQRWMAKHLNVGTMLTLNIVSEIDGDCTGDSHPDNQTNNEVIEKYCFENDAANCETYGGLYQWNEAMNYATTPGAQGICPNGWHIPTDDEWKELEMTLGMTQAEADGFNDRGTDQGDQLKAAADCFGIANCGTSGFNALFGGSTSPDGSFYTAGFYNYIWTSSTSSDDCYAWYRKFGYDSAQAGRADSFNKNNAYSCRCIQD
jgi:uncharacterized protein (TIGR02145 family)